MTFQGQRSEWIVVIAVSALVVAVSLTTMVSYLIYRPGDTVYPLVHNYPPDYYSNLSMMRFGMEGSFAVTSRYTPERFKPQVASILPLFGMAARLLGVSLPIAYNGARIAFGLGLLLTGYVLASTLFPTRFERIGAFLLMIAGTPIWMKEGSSYSLAGTYWTGFDPILRVTFLPHHLMSVIFFILAILAFARAVDRNSYAWSLVASLCALVSAAANPAGGYTTFVALGISALLSPKMILPRIGHYLMVGAPLVGLSWYLYRLQFSTFPFTSYKDVERFWFYPASHGELLKVLGVTSLFATIGLLLALRIRRTLWNLVVGWFLAPFIGVEVLATLLPVTNARFFQTAPYIPTAILAAHAIQTILSRAASARIRIILYGVIFFFVAINAVPAWAISIATQSKIGRSGRSLAEYVPRSMMGAFSWLATHGQRDEVVLAPMWATTMIPGLSGKRVVGGHQTNVYDPETKIADVLAFYAFIDEKRANEMIRRYGIAYVIIERTNPAPSSFIDRLSLIPVYQNEGVILYTPM